MSKLFHRSRIYTKQYYLSCILFGIMISWGESLIIWVGLPFRIGVEEILSLNIFAIVIGGMTGLLASVISLMVNRIFYRSQRIDREVHHTAWAFSLSISLIVLIIILFTFIELWIRLLLAAALTFIVFILMYQYAAKLLFRRKHAGRLTIEALLVVFILIYFVKHPGFFKEIPLNEPKQPHVMIFDIPGLSHGEAGLSFLNDCMGMKDADALFCFDFAFTVTKDDKANIEALFRYNDGQSQADLLGFLKSKEYHSGYFSAGKRGFRDINQYFDMVDNQTHSLKSRLSLFNFYARILPFLRLYDFLGRLEGYSQDDSRDLVKVNERIKGWIKRERDDKPFFLIVECSTTQFQGQAKQTEEIKAFQALFSFMRKSRMLDNSLIFFTSFADEDIHRPLALYYYSMIPDFPEIKYPVSYLDIPGVIFAEVADSSHNSQLALDLADIIEETIPPSRAVFVWEKEYGPHQPAVAVFSYPWLCERKDSGVYVLRDLENDSPDLSREYPDLLRLFKEMLQYPGDNLFMKPNLTIKNSD